MKVVRNNDSGVAVMKVLHLYCSLMSAIPEATRLTFRPSFLAVAIYPVILRRSRRQQVPRWSRDRSGIHGHRPILLAATLHGFRLYSLTGMCVSPVLPQVDLSMYSTLMVFYAVVQVPNLLLSRMGSKPSNPLAGPPQTPSIVKAVHDAGLEAWFKNMEAILPVESLYPAAGAPDCTKPM